MDNLIRLFEARFVSGCVNVNHNSINATAFTGSVLVAWVAAGAESAVGDSQFRCVPVGGREFAFTHPVKPGSNARPLTAIPAAFYTDSGFVPRSVQAFGGLSVRGFGPACVIHDWIFVARKRLSDRNNNGDNHITPEVAKVVPLDFTDIAEIMAETIKTLARDYPIHSAEHFSRPVITLVPSGPVTRRLGIAEGNCTDLQVRNPDHLELIRDLQRQSNADLLVSLDKSNGSRVRVWGQRYKIMATFDLDELSGAEQ
ncbi:hypothetical protein [Ruegeria sp. HKCCA4812]|uniref:hypothetical protein n=1 Tax=Ruegeria sp. HKCCA4812 TaxID=2682993 RepID=UPI00148988C7|nr:hypothetical protein [Ruegeria sp. HKCCA4812]